MLVWYSKFQKVRGLINRLKKYIQTTFPKLYAFASNIKRRAKIKDNLKTLIYIHIGKCGGLTLGNASTNSPLVKKKFSSFHKIHVEKPPILKKSSYAIIVRNPIERAISAFNWRYKLVVTDKRQKNRFGDEYKILKKYGTLNALCEQLFVDGVLNCAVSDEFQKIHHLKENISFYLNPLLDEILPSQLFAVFATETLDEDITNILSLKNELYVHQNSNKVSDDSKFLTKKAYHALKTYLIDDYLYLTKLITMNTTSSVDKNLLLN